MYDGSGAEGRVADVLLRDDRVAGVGTFEGVDADVIDATGLAVAPGFINTLSHAASALQLDGSGASDLLQGVTTEVFGEGASLGPSDGRLGELLRRSRGIDPTVRLDYPRLADGLADLESRGVAPNVASFVGGSNVRLLAAGSEDRPLEDVELARLKGVLAEEMQDGALGLGTALIYPPDAFWRSHELIALSEVVASHGGTYISHLRSEGDRFLECLDELLLIARCTGVRATVHHLKAAGRRNWPKMATAIAAIDQARADGLAVSANMYPYEAGATGLAACIPPSYHVGGPLALRERLEEPSQRAAMAADIRSEEGDFENVFLGSGGGRGILFFEDFADGVPAAGRRLSDVAGDAGMDEAECLVELVRRHPQTLAAFFVIDEANIQFGLRQPWVSVGSDGEAHPNVAPFTDRATHPRTYGTFARVLGHYCREQGLFPLREAVRRMTSLPAEELGLKDRGLLAAGCFADVVIFDPQTIQDHATYVASHQYATGVVHVLVNGVPVVRDGCLEATRPGRHLRLNR